MPCGDYRRLNNVAVPDRYPLPNIFTPFRMFEFLRLPFSLKNTGNSFQQMKCQILGILPYCSVYIDDILVFSPNLTFHNQHLRDNLEMCHTHSMTIGLGNVNLLFWRPSSSTLFPSTPFPFKIFLCLWINLDFRGSLVC